MGFDGVVLEWEEGNTLITLSLSGCSYTRSRAGKQRAGDARGFTEEHNKRGKTEKTSSQTRTDMKFAPECVDLLLSF